MIRDVPPKDYVDFEFVRGYVMTDLKSDKDQWKDRDQGRELAVFLDGFIPGDPCSEKSLDYHCRKTHAYKTICLSGF
jgi:hypothetical protein